MGLVRLTTENKNHFKDEIEAIEENSEYPLGTDFFKINHGADYFAFFERLGKLTYYLWLENGAVAAVAAGIIRTLKIRGESKKFWYLCDLKVLPKYRGLHIPLRMLSRALPLNYLRCSRGYAISMNPANGAPNRTVKLLKRYRWLNFGNSANLFLWSLDKKDMEKAIPIIEKYRGPVSFLSLRGIKDIVLKSTDKPMELLHAQYGPAGAGSLPSSESALHMFCAPEHDPLATEIQTLLGLKPSASATVISHRMTDFDWQWVLTSDI